MASGHQGWPSGSVGVQRPIVSPTFTNHLPPLSADTQVTMPSTGPPNGVSASAAALLSPHRHQLTTAHLSVLSHAPQMQIATTSLGLRLPLAPAVSSHYGQPGSAFTSTGRSASSIGYAPPSSHILSPPPQPQTLLSPPLHLSTRPPLPWLNGPTAPPPASLAQPRTHQLPANIHSLLNPQMLLGGTNTTTVNKSSVIAPVPKQISLPNEEKSAKILAAVIDQVNNNKDRVSSTTSQTTESNEAAAKQTLEVTAGQLPTSTSSTLACDVTTQPSATQSHQSMNESPDTTNRSPEAATIQQSTEEIATALEQPERQPSADSEEAMKIDVEAVDDKPAPPSVVTSGSSEPQTSIALSGSVQRAPGHDAASTENRSETATTPSVPMTTQSSGPYNCQICGFSSSSKFHFNSHMNTHTDHQCTMCDYTSRTEGRLKRHMKVFHSREEQLEAGLSPPPALENDEPTLNGDMPALINGDGERPSVLSQMQALTERSMESEDSPQLSAGRHSSATPSARGSNSPNTGTTTPRRHSSKPKIYKCKQCPTVHHTKEEHWQHARTHIPPEKQLVCPKCDFVTEYKHHLEYHLRNHFNSKPFQCTKCKYTCVNKSMLNSHMKSHSNYYQYRCNDCTYATKYCHSLKLHLRKYGHRPSTVISADGTSIDPNTFEVINHRTGKKGNGRASTTSRTPPSASGSSSTVGGNTPNTARPDSAGARPSPLPFPIAQLLATPRSPQEASSLIQRLIAMGIPVAQLQAHLRAMANGAAPPLPPTGPPPTLPPHLQGLAGTLGSLGPNSAFVPPSSLPNNPSPLTLLQHYQQNRVESPIACSQCQREFPNRTELLKHHLANHATGLSGLSSGLASNLPQFASNLQRLTQAIATTSANLLSASTAHVNDSSAQNGASVEAANAPNESPPSNGDSPMINIEDDGVECTAPPVEQKPKVESVEDDGVHSDATSGAESGSRKRKASIKLEQISKRLQQAGSNGSAHSPQSRGSTSDEHEHHHHHESRKPQLNGRTADSSPSSATSASVALNSGRGLSPAAYLAALMQQRRTNGEEPQNEKSSLHALATFATMQQQQMQNSVNGNGANFTFVCDHCNIAFQNQVMHHIHMAYHAYDDPYKCNRCGHQESDAIAYNLHLLQAKHD